MYPMDLSFRKEKEKCIQWILGVVILNGINNLLFLRLLGMTLRQALSITVTSKRIASMVLVVLHSISNINLHIHVMDMVDTSIIIY